MSPNAIRIVFDYDDGFGNIIPVVAHFDPTGDEIEIIDIDACGRKGGELSDHTMKCIEEKALELAYIEVAERAQDHADNARDEQLERRAIEAFERRDV